MKILHIASLHNLVSSGVGVVVPQHIRAQQEYADVALINIFGLEIPNIKKQIIYSQNSIDAILNENNFEPDIVVFHEVYHIEFCKIAKHLCKRKIPYIIVPHGCLTNTAQNKKKIKKIKANTLYFRKFIQNAVALQCLSENERDNTKFNSNKFIGTNGVSIPTYKKTTFSDDEIKIVYIGRLDFYHKGIDLMLEAIRQKKDYFIENNCKLYIYGPDYTNERKVVKKLIEDNNVQDIVTISDAVLGTEKEKALLNADIFIQTSRFEGMPLGILEALSYGVPCLITEGTNVGNYVKKYNAGWVAKTNSNSIADKISQAIFERKLWKEKSVNAVNLVNENFSWEEISKQAIRDYERLI